MCKIGSDLTSYNKIPLHQLPNKLFIKTTTYVEDTDRFLN